MNGRGIHLRTSELTNDLFAQIPFAVIGAIGVLTGLFMIFATYYDIGARPINPWVAVILNLYLFPAGVWLMSFYWQALRRLEQHTAMMKAETELHGKGWAHD